MHESLNNIDQSKSSQPTSRLSFVRSSVRRPFRTFQYFHFEALSRLFKALLGHVADFNNIAATKQKSSKPTTHAVPCTAIASNVCTYGKLTRASRFVLRARSGKKVAPFVGTLGHVGARWGTLDDYRGGLLVKLYFGFSKNLEVLENSRISRNVIQAVQGHNRPCPDLDAGLCRNHYFTP